MPLSWALLRAAGPDKRLSCAAAFEVCSAQSASPEQVGQTADALGIRLTLCQLGLFGRGDDGAARQPPSPALLEAVAAHGQRGLPCVEAWRIADSLGVCRRDVGAAADMVGTKIISCQLGCF